MPRGVLLLFPFINPSRSYDFRRRIPRVGARVCGFTCLRKETFFKGMKALGMHRAECR